GIYTYSWTPVSNLSSDTIPNPIFHGPTTTNLQLIISDPIGCSDTDNVLMTVNPSNFLVVTGDKSICPGDTTQLSVVGAVNYLWHPTMYLDDSTAAAINAFPIATTTYTVYGVNTKGCLDSATTYVVVYPEAVLDAGENQTLYPGEIAQLNADGNCSFFGWFPPNGLSATNIKNPLSSPSVTTRYYVNGRTEAGCETLDSVDVIISPESLLDLPNAFSPGAGTGSNDELKIIVKGIVTLNSFKIYNRWGQEIFSTTDINKGWDGRFKGVPQPLGTYVYLLDAVSSTGKRFFKQGNITLIR
ncbi:MAG TPA: gliding motility-associated C-terminal domain-containing protein, partial [Chitinophagaceae bacterium]|nr:gliding motility-associated C-terminal domain-containing protein [Chitinophagaceae bacterium]